MKQLTAILILLLSTALDGYSQFNTAYNSQINYKELSYEVCTAKALQKTEVKVAIQFVLESAENQKIEMDEVWIFPREIADGKGNKFKEVKSVIEKPTNENIYSSYTLTEQTDLVKGKWKYKLYHKRKLLCEKEFLVE